MRVTEMEILSKNSELISLISYLLGILSVIFSVVLFFKKIVLEWFLKRKLSKYQYMALGYNINDDTKKTFDCYISARWQKVDPCNFENDNPCDSEELIPYMMCNIKKNSNKYYIILGDSGMGKTTSLYMIFFYYYKKIFRRYMIKFVPLYNKYVIREIEEIENKQNTILLLDGLDENNEAMQDYEKFLDEIIDSTTKFYMIIISCRTHFFSNEAKEPQYINSFSVNTMQKKDSFVKIYLSPFNDEEIEKYLNLKYRFDKKKIECSKSIIRNCHQLMMRPLLLSYIDDLITDEGIKYNYIFEIYNTLVLKWLERESIQDIGNLFRFSLEMAEYMYKNKTIFISETEIGDICKKYNIRTINAKSRSLLNRTSNGNYKFAHKSILEYFLAVKAFNNIQFRKMFMSKNLNGFDMTQLFLKEMCNSYIQKVQQMNNKSYCISFRYFNWTYFSFKRMYLNNCDFSGCNMFGADFEDARIGNVCFSNANLSKAILANVDLRKTQLIGAIFVNAELRGVRFDKVNMTGAKLIGADLSGANLTNANLTNAIFDEKQIASLEYRFDFGNSKVYTNENIVVNYQEYCIRRNSESLI